MDLASDLENDEDQLIIRQKVPKQLPGNGGDQLALEVFGSVASTSKAVSGANFALNFILSASLNQLWTMVNA